MLEADNNIDKLLQERSFKFYHMLKIADTRYSDTDIKKASIIYGMEEKV